MNLNAKPKLLAAGLFAATALTGAAGWFDARLSNRWSTPHELEVAAQRLAEVPTRVGDWQMQSTSPLTPDVEKMLQCVGNFNRSYVNTATREVVDVAAIVGPPGPTSSHTPEICYTSHDHIELDKPTPVSIRPQERPDEDFWRMTFKANDLDGARLRVYYAWSDASGVWTAAQYPRFKYGGQPLLYKIQLASHWDESKESEGGDPCRRFLESFLPALDKALFQ
jgi:Protein of unknown function (DUF3485)